MNEFSLIEKYLCPLAKDFPGSLNLTDDAARLDVPAGKQLVITKDAMSADVHFNTDEPANIVAQKLLRTNLSDLAAKGAVPHCYFIAAHLPKDIGEAWIRSFAEGLARDQQEFSIKLAGGDTTATTGPLCLSLTALGLVDQGAMLTRSDAKLGDDIYVSGSLGQAAKAFLQTGSTPLPQPRLALGQRLASLATACMDVSDGLMQDLEHLCNASGVGADIKREALPLPEAANWQELLTFGDDYELLFTAPQKQQAAIETLAVELSIALTRVGKITEHREINLLDARGYAIALSKKGYSHF